jgi:hypothetical protein
MHWRFEVTLHISPFPQTTVVELALMQVSPLPPHASLRQLHVGEATHAEGIDTQGEVVTQPGGFVIPSDAPSDAAPSDADVAPSDADVAPSDADVAPSDAEVKAAASDWIEDAPLSGVTTSAMSIKQLVAARKMEADSSDRPGITKQAYYGARQPPRGASE